MSKREQRRRTIAVDLLARVEGEGSLEVRIAAGRVVSAKLAIFEPPRFFEALLRGRAFTEAVDITARICGICPVAYQLTACHALEQACDVRVDGPLRALRRLLYCGEWIESHALHVVLLHAPDFLGYPSAIEMARDHQAFVQRGLALKKTGNAVLELLGGRAIHPVNVRVGGFHKVPSRSALRTLVEPLKRGLDDALATLATVSTFDIPDFDRDYRAVALRGSGEYPLDEGRIGSSDGLDIGPADFPARFAERQSPHSHALHGETADGAHYLVGPLARYNLNSARLSPVARQAARDAGLGERCHNPFRGIVVRGVELVYAFEEALRIVEGYVPPDRPFVPVAPRAATGHGCTEAPRGLLYHSYRLDADGTIVEARIVPPTSQNLPTMEDDLRLFVERHLALADRELGLRCEQVVRNHDPCISCATHFLTVDVVRD